MKKNRSSAAHAAEMTFSIGSPYSDFGGGKPRPVIVRKAGLTAAEVVELASLDRVSTGDLTSSEKERLDGLRVRRSSFGLANMRAALTEAYGAVDYYRAVNLSRSRTWFKSAASRSVPT
ncbi:MAG TPA: hypothetical protein VEP66_22980 [Myxococcales bacterium]|nr:hypothetical protein [Myxococcales bacterium]